MKPLVFIRQVLAICIISQFSFLQPVAEDCVLDVEIPIDWNDSIHMDGNWGGFLKHNCCGSPFAKYLYALGHNANLTGEIFLNISEQKFCLTTTQADLSNCGVDQLTSGNGVCSDYTVTDVVNNLGTVLENFRQDCNNLGSNLTSDEECNSCLRRWEQMKGSINISNEVEPDICRFSALIYLTSERIIDVGWIQSLYTCLGNGIPRDDQARKTKRVTFVTGLEVLIGGLAGVSLAAAIVLVIMLKKRNKRQTTHGMDASEDSYSEESSCDGISLKEIYLATDNLSESNFIGQGVAGKVYKGILSHGQRVAIKHIITDDGHMETFVREVTSLSHVKHPNLVALLGHCDGEEESFLVYELCDNGNLSEWLFGKHKYLTWIQRLEIAIDCARGLSFLHTYPEGCIVHRDIKPTNILLSADFQGKLSDFGLSKVMCMGVSYVSSEVRGTFGYVDPEYQKNHRVHSSTDVYSFGIVLLQILSGQRVINLDVTRPMPLSKMAKNLVKGGEITDFADPKFNGEYSIEGFELIFRLALSCTSLKQQRPSMEKVVGVLEKAYSISQRFKSFDHSFSCNAY